MSEALNQEALDRAIAFIRVWLKARHAGADWPGAAVAIAHRGTLLLNEAYGWANVEQQVPLTPAHRFRIASHSKTFTATALMMLVEDGRVRLDNPVGQYVPWLGRHRDERWQHVTLRQLLSHGAGVIRDGRDTDYWQLARPFPDREQFQAEMLDNDLVLDNNTRLKYSNYGYTLLGLVVEAVSGQPYNQFVVDRIIKPLGLSHTAPEYDPADTDLATGYSRRDGQRRRALGHVSTHAMSAATGFVSTAADLCQYFAAHMVGSGQLLSDESKKEMQREAWAAKTPGTSEHSGYGLGFVVQELGGHRVFGHSGGFPGFITFSAAAPDSGLVVVSLTNADVPAGSMVKGIYQALLYFQEHADSSAAHDGRRLEGHYLNLWGEMLLVAAGGKMATANPGSWDPFAGSETLEFVDGDTLRVTETSSFGSEGELVRFHWREGQVETMRYAGSTMWPEPAWRQRQESL